MQNSKNTAYIIFGASGDLARRYLLPAISNLQAAGFAGQVVLVSRKDYGNLKNLVMGNKEKQDETEKIFHLAIPPEGVPEAIEIISSNFGRVGVKIILEKPFGKDLPSAQSLVSHIDAYFSEEQIYRVDHYLAKESLQKVVREKWKRKDIAGIAITASEQIDIEGRINFYEQTGALKDFVQSHLLEMVAVVLSGSFEAIRREEALRNLGIVCDITKQDCVKRGQYEGYRAEVHNPASMTETFVSINMVSNDPAWRGVPITLATGKALREKLTQIKITYKDDNENNENKREKIFNIEHEPGAYGRVLAAVMAGNHDLFISSGEILEAWRIVDVVEQSWKNSKDDLVIYSKGSGIEDVLNL